jgi:hypothetical protein
MLMNYELQNIDTVVELMLKPYRGTTFNTGRYGKNFGGQNFIERFKENLKIRLEEEKQSDVPVTLIEVLHDTFDRSLLPE